MNEDNIFNMRRCVRSTKTRKPRKNTAVDIQIFNIYYYRNISISVLIVQKIMDLLFYLSGIADIMDRIYINKAMKYQQKREDINSIYSNRL